MSKYVRIINEWLVKNAQLNVVLSDLCDLETAVMEHPSVDMINAYTGSYFAFEKMLHKLVDDYTNNYFVCVGLDDDYLRIYKLGYINDGITPIHVDVNTSMYELIQDGVKSMVGQMLEATPLSELIEKMKNVNK